MMQGRGTVSLQDASGSIAAWFASGWPCACLQDFSTYWEGSLPFERASLLLTAGSILLLVAAVLLRLCLSSSSKPQQAESAQELEGARRKLELVTAASPEPVVGFDGDYLIRSWNRAAEAFYGQKAESALGKPILALAAPAVEEGWQASIRSVLAQGGQARFDSIHQRADGSSLEVSVTLVAVPGRDGRAVGGYAFCRDAAAERQMAKLLDLAADAIFVQRLDGRIQYWSRGAERLYGWTAEEATTNLVVHWPSMESEAAWGDLLGRGAWRGEISRPRKDGSELVVDSRWALMRDAQGNPEALLVIDTDLTERKALETRLIRAQRLEAVGNLAAGVAHDLNNLLTPVMMSIPMFRGDLADEEKTILLDTMEKSAERAATILRHLLTYSRGQPGETVELDMGTLLNQSMKSALQMFPGNIEVRVELREGLWEIRGDPSQLHFALLELFKNAREAMPSGGALKVSAENSTVSAEMAAFHPGAAAGPHIRITVSDSGCGMDPGILDRIFEPFFTTKKPGEGSGLGLSTTLGVVKAHGGFVKVQSERGLGSTFSVFLPAHLNPSSSETGGSAAADLIGRGEVVLVVDDEPVVRLATLRLLRRANYEALLAAEANEAMVLFRDRRSEIRVVITDLVMPGTQGEELIRALRKLDPLVNIIATTGISDRRKLAETEALGVAKVVLKPYSGDELLRVLREVLSSPTLPSAKP